jgi:flagellar P-ring protein precursor FlgI
MRSFLKLLAAALALLMAAPSYAITTASLSPHTVVDNVRLKDLGRFLGWRDNALIGYGIVTGLAGSGDSPRSNVTRQALSNVLSRLGANISGDVLQSRNVAAVMVTSTLPPSANVGDRIDVTVTSIGDARSLVGGILLMTPLLGPDQKPYALAQGALVVGGYNFEDNVNLRQKNYPTTGIVSGGATVEDQVAANLTAADGHLTFILKDPDFTTAQRIADALIVRLGPGAATVESAEAVRIAANGGNPNALISSIENISVAPDEVSRVVINERSGTVVAGGAVRISSVVIAQGDIKVSVTTDDSSPYGYYGGGGGRGRDGRPFVTNTHLEVSDATNDAAVKFPNTTVADLVRGLTQAHVGTRNVIAILQAIKAAGALHAEIIVQ